MYMYRNFGKVSTLNQKPHVQDWSQILATRPAWDRSSEATLLVTSIGTSTSTGTGTGTSTGRVARSLRDRGTVLHVLVVPVLYNLM